MAGVYSIGTAVDRAGERANRIAVTRRTLQDRLYRDQHFLEMIMNSVVSASARLAMAIATCGGLSVGLSGCMTAKIEEMREAPTQITNADAIVLLAKPHLEGTGTEDKFLDCLERELVGEAVSAGVASKQKSGKQFDARSSIADRPFQIYADNQFVDALYPWLEPSTAPANAQGFTAFLG